MIHYVSPGRRARYNNELEQYFRLRKRIFCDKLGWVDCNGSDREIDRFDSLYNVYILYIDPDSGLVGGGVRLMPTSGPALIHSVWADMLPDGSDFRSPDIWEATRFCIDEEISSRKSNLSNRATLSLSMAVADFGHANGITHVIAVCEDYFFQMAGAYGPKADILSSKLDENGLKISCGVWATDTIQAHLTWSRALTGNAEPVMVDKLVA